MPALTFEPLKMDPSFPFFTNATVFGLPWLPCVWRRRLVTAVRKLYVGIDNIWTAAHFAFRSLPLTLTYDAALDVNIIVIHAC